MAKKPSYEKLERKVKELEKQTVERKRAEEELEAQKNKFHTILDSVASGIDIVNYDYKVQFQNKLLVDRFGDLKGKLCYKQYMNCWRSPIWSHLMIAVMEPPCDRLNGATL